MQIEFTKEQFMELLRAAYLADWMAGVAETEGVLKDSGLPKFARHVFKLAHDAGFTGLIHHDKQTGEYYPTRKFDDDPTLSEVIGRYDNEAFWDELIMRLGERDLYRKFSAVEIAGMDAEERMDEMDECEAGWEDEFADHGLARLGVKREQPEKK